MEEIGIKGAEIVQQNIATPYEGKPAAVCFGHLEASISFEVQWLGDAAHEIIGVNPQLGADAMRLPLRPVHGHTCLRPLRCFSGFRRSSASTTRKEALSVAFAVAKNIAKRGTQGHQMFSRALEELQPMIVPALEKNIAIALARHGFTQVGA
jgi:hypothetical protein